MSQQQYSLRWNNHQPNFISMFTSLLNTQTLVDVTLSAEGKQLLAHKVVLSACSTYFQSLFVENPAPHPIVILKDVTFTDLRTMVDFMYCGVVNVTEEQLPKVLDTAKLLKIKGLTEMPESTSLTRSQSDRNGGTEQAESMDTQENAVEPGIRKKRRRKSSPAVVAEAAAESMASGSPQPMEQITFCSVPQRRYNEIRTIDNTQTQEAAESTDHSVELIEPSPDSQGIWTSDGYNQRYNACIGAGMVASDAGMPYMVGLPQDGAYASAPAECLAGPSTAPSPKRATKLINRRKRSTNPRASENFQRALEAVRYGGIGFCKAAKIFGVNNRTLWLEYKKKGYPNTRPSIRSRVKKENKSSPVFKSNESQQMSQQQIMLCPQQQMPQGYVEAGQHAFLQGVPPNSISLLVSGASSGEANRQHRPKLLKRQSRVPEIEVRKQRSEPAAAAARPPALVKHDSYPQYAQKDQASTSKKAISNSSDDIEIFEIVDLTIDETCTEMQGNADRNNKIKKNYKTANNDQSENNNSNSDNTDENQKKDKRDKKEKKDKNKNNDKSETNDKSENNEKGDNTDENQKKDKRDKKEKKDKNKNNDKNETNDKSENNEKGDNTDENQKKDKRDKKEKKDKNKNNDKNETNDKSENNEKGDNTDENQKKDKRDKKEKKDKNKNNDKNETNDKSENNEKGDNTNENKKKDKRDKKAKKDKNENIEKSDNTNENKKKDKRDKKEKKDKNKNNEQSDKTAENKEKDKGDKKDKKTKKNKNIKDNDQDDNNDQIETNDQIEKSVKKKKKGKKENQEKSSQSSEKSSSRIKKINEFGTYVACSLINMKRQYVKPCKKKIESTLTKFSLMGEQESTPLPTSSMPSSPPPEDHDCDCC